MLISLRPSTYVMGSNDSLGSFGVTCYNLSTLHSMIIYGNFNISINFQTLYHICGIFRQPGVSQGSRSQNRQDTPSVTATCLVLILPAQPQDLVSYSFLLSSSSFFFFFFWQHIFFTHFPTSYFDQTWSQ